MPVNMREILERVERGELSAQQGAALLAGGEEPHAPETPVPVSAEAQDTPPPGAGEAQAETPAPDPGLEERLEYWKRWWMVPLWIGMGIFAIGAALIAWGHTSQRVFWFVCGFFPLFFGLFAMLVAWWSQTARWVHVRVKEGKQGGTRVMISLPVPLRLAGWFLRTFGNAIPGLREQKSAREMIGPMLDQLEKDREPIAIEVNDKDGTEVQVYIT